MYKQRTRGYEDESENWNDRGMYQGMLAVTRRWKRQGRDAPMEHLDGVWPC